MTPFTLEQLQRVSDIYAPFIGISKVNIHLVRTDSKFKQRMGHAYGMQSNNPRKIFIIPKVLTLSRQAQLALLIHEMCHFKRKNHKKSWKQAVTLWGSLYQMRYVRSDESVKRHIAGGCPNLDTWRYCDACVEKYGNPKTLQLESTPNGESEY